MGIEAPVSGAEIPFMSIALVLIGPSGSGKSTLGQALSVKTGLDLISSGDIARSLGEVDQYTRAGLERGDWAPELAMRTEILARIEAAVTTTGDFIIEGFPRKIEQLYILESIPDIRPIYYVLDCDPLICIRRLVSRGRDEDHPDAVATRFRAYREHTEPMIDVLHQWSIELNGNLTTDTLVNDVLQVHHIRSQELKWAEAES